MRNSYWVEFRRAMFFGLLGLGNVALAIADFRVGFVVLALFNTCVAILTFAAAIQNLYDWRTTWDSPKPPISKSSPPNPSPSSSRSRIVSIPPVIPNPSPPNAGPPLVPIATRKLATVPVDVPAIGFRTWVVAGAVLRSINLDNGWWCPGVNRAVCIKKTARYFGSPLAAPHDAPDPRCTCGIYAWHHVPDRAHRTEMRVTTGAVLGWGRIVRHGSEGFRAQYMRPICLARPERDDYPVVDDDGPLCRAASIQGGMVTVRQPGSGKGALVAAGVISGTILTITYTAAGFTMLGNGHLLKGNEGACCNCGMVVKRPLPDADWALYLAGREALAESLGLPLVPLDHLEAYASEFGASIKDLAAPDWSVGEGDLVPKESA